MVVLIDTNVLLDDILCRTPRHQHARRISQLVADGQITGYLTTTCLTDIFYIVAKMLDERAAKKTIRALLLSFSVISVAGEDCSQAVDLPLPDFEDALMIVCAVKVAADFLITNDKKLLAKKWSVTMIDSERFTALFSP